MPPARETSQSPAPKIEEDEEIAVCHFCDKIGHSSMKCIQVRTSTQRHMNIKGKNLCIRCLEPNNIRDDKRHDPCPKADIKCMKCVKLYEKLPQLYGHDPILCEFNALPFLRDEEIQKLLDGGETRRDRVQKRNQAKALSKFEGETVPRRREESVLPSVSRGKLEKITQKVMNSLKPKKKSVENGLVEGGGNVSKVDSGTMKARFFEMASKSPNIKFKVGEELVCLHAGDKPYLARILKIKEYQGILKYVVHFIGWNKRYDEKITVGEEDGKMFKGSVEDYEKNHGKSEKKPKRKRADTPYSVEPKRRPPPMKAIESMEDALEIQENPMENIQNSEDVPPEFDVSYDFPKDLGVPSPIVVPEFIVEEIVEAEKTKCLFCDETDHEPTKCTIFPSSQSRIYCLMEKNICVKCLSPNNLPYQNLHIPCPRQHEECSICSFRYQNMFPAHHEMICEFNDVSYQSAFGF